MAQIDLGKFGNASPVVVATPVAPADAGVAWGEAAKMGRVGFDLAKDYLDSTNRGKIGVAVQAHDEATDRAAIAAQDKMLSGELSPMQAEGYFQSVLDKIEPEQIPYLSPEQESAYQTALAQSRQRAMHRVLTGAKSAAEVDQGRTAAALVDGAYRSGIVAADPELQIWRIEQAAQPGGVLFKTYGEKAPGAVAEVAAKIYDTRLSTDVVKYEVAGDAVSLGRLQEELNDDNSLKSKRLGDNRASILSRVTSAIDRLTNRSTHETNQREVAAKRAVQDYADGLKLGVTYSPEQVATYKAKAEGTEAAEMLSDLMASEGSVRKAATSSGEESAPVIMDMAKKVSEAKAAGNAKLTARLTRLLEITAQAADAAKERVNKNPVDFVEARTGKAFDPISQEDFVRQDALAQKIVDRSNALSALRSEKGFSGKVGYAILKEAEADWIAGLLTGNDYKQSVGVLQALRTATGNDKASYAAIISQIAPKSAPAVAIAGMRVDPPVDGYVRSGLWSKKLAVGNVAENILRGMDILGQLKPKSKNEQSKKDVSLVPGLDLFEKALGKNVTMFKAIPTSDRPSVLDAARAFYAAMLETSQFSPAPEETNQLSQADEAINAVAGSYITAPVGSGDEALLVPWGMPTTEFTRQLEAGWGAAVARGEADGGKETLYRIFAVPGSNGERYRFAARDGLLMNLKDRATPLELTVTLPRR